MRLVYSAALLFVALLVPSFAHADTYNFTLTSQSGETYTFSIDPANDFAFPEPTDNTNFYFSTVTDTYQGNALTVPTPFVGIVYTPGSQAIEIGEVIWTLSTDIYNGTTFIPTTPGSPLPALFYGMPDYPYDLTITDTPSVATTPEPSSLALLGTGVLGVAGAVRRRFVRA